MKDVLRDLWDQCYEHDWQIDPSDWDLGDVSGTGPFAGPREAVICSKCQCPGERYINSGEVEWPTT